MGHVSGTVDAYPQGGASCQTQHGCSGSPRRSSRSWRSWRSPYWAGPAISPERNLPGGRPLGPLAPVAVTTTSPFSTGPPTESELGGRGTGTQSRVKDESDAPRAIADTRRSQSRGAEGTRTPDPLHAMQMRYQLRHSPEVFDDIVSDLGRRRGPSTKATLAHRLIAAQFTPPQPTRGRESLSMALRPGRAPASPRTQDRRPWPRSRSGSRSPPQPWPGRPRRAGAGPP